MTAAGGLMSREITLSSLKAAFLRFCAWERDEFRSMLPPAALAWLMGRGAREAVVKAGASELVVAAEPGGREIPISGGEIAEMSLETAFAKRRLSRKSVAVVLEMPAAAFLTREFEAPSAALAHLPQMIDAEIGRRTPFRRDEVLLGQHVGPNRAKGKATVHLTLLRRDLIGSALEPSGLSLDDLAEIRAEGVPKLTIRVGESLGNDRRFQQGALAMIIIAALLVCAGLGATFWRQSQQASELDAQIAEASARAARVRQIADRASKESRLLAILHETRRNNAPVTAIWEEVSRLLPDTAYLNDFHLSESKSGERTVDLAGFAQSAVGLPLLLDQSSYFTDATLTAPITSDAREKLENFSLRLKVRAPVPVAANGGGVSGSSGSSNGEPRR